MTDEQQLQQIAAQLRKPHGEDGLKTAEWMNKGSLHIHLEPTKVLTIDLLFFNLDYRCFRILVEVCLHSKPFKFVFAPADAAVRLDTSTTKILVK